MARVMEKTWERIQQKTFTGWVNSHLKKVGMKVEDVTEDLKDGLKLIALCQVISGEDFPVRYEKKPNHRIKMVGNCSAVLQWLGTKGIKLTGIGGEDICDGNLKLILGLIWTIILRFQIQDISMEELSAKEALLLWCKRKTESYKPEVDVQNFHTSWQSGLAFCALIHKHRPDLLDYDALDKSDKVGCLNKAFQVAEQELGVPQLLDANDIVELDRPDERSIITYVSLYYHVFSSSQMAEMAGKRVQKLLDFNEQVQKMKDEYSQRASDLRQWMEAKDGEFQGREFPNSLEGVQGKMSDLKAFKQGEKNEKNDEKTQLEAFWNALQTKLSVNKRPAFVAPEGLAPQELDSCWSGMEGSERDYSAALLAEFRRQKKIRDLLRRFNQKLGKLEGWIAEKKESLASDSDLGSNVSACRAKLKAHEGLEEEITTQESREKVLKQIYDELAALNFADLAQLDEKLAAKDSHKAELDAAAAERKAALEAELARLQAIEDQLLDYSKRAQALRQWADDADDTLNDPISVESPAGVDELNQELEGVVAQTAEKEAEMEGLRQLVQEIANAGFKETTFSPTSLADVERVWAAHAENIAQRRAALEEEATRQQQHEEMRVDFAGKADEFSNATRAATDSVNNAAGSPDEQLAAVSAITASFDDMRAQYDAIVAVAQAMEAEGITENAHTTHTMDSLRNAWNSLSTLAAEKQKAISAEVAKASQKSQLPPELQAEYQEAFNAFDKDRDGSLNRLELGGALKALGYDHLVGELEQEGGPLDQLLAEIAKTHEGAVTFDEFLGKLEALSSDAESPDQVREAFQTIAGGRAEFVTEAELRAVLPGEKVDSLVQVMPKVGDDQYDYAAYCAEGGAAFQ